MNAGVHGKLPAAAPTAPPPPPPGVTLQLPPLSGGTITTHQYTFEQLYQTDSELRSGSFGTVYTCHHRGESHDPPSPTKTTTYAVKIVDRTKLKRNHLDDDTALYETKIIREIEIMRELVLVPTVVRLVDFFVEPNALYIVQVYAAGGDVFDRLRQRERYTEWDARHLAQQLVSAVRALHAHGIVHRDLKPENLLLNETNKKNQDDNSDGDGNDTSGSIILVADFGFARHVGTNSHNNNAMTESSATSHAHYPPNVCHTRCGTPAYCAPEIIIGVPYSTQCDLWSVGCILYMLLCGSNPSHFL
jgi:serine/threonine protein kinase